MNECLLSSLRKSDEITGIKYGNLMHTWVNYMLLLQFSLLPKLWGKKYSCLHFIRRHRQELHLVIDWQWVNYNINTGGYQSGYWLNIEISWYHFLCKMGPSFCITWNKKIAFLLMFFFFLPSVISGLNAWPSHFWDSTPWPNATPSAHASAPAAPQAGGIPSRAATAKCRWFPPHDAPWSESVPTTADAW